MAGVRRTTPKPNHPNAGQGLNILLMGSGPRVGEDEDIGGKVTVMKIPRATAPIRTCFQSDGRAG